MAVDVGRRELSANASLSGRLLNTTGFVNAYKISLIYFSTINKLVNYNFQRITGILPFILKESGVTKESRARTSTPVLLAYLKASPKAG